MATSCIEEMSSWRRLSTERHAPRMRSSLLLLLASITTRCMGGARSSWTLKSEPSPCARSAKPIPPSSATRPPFLCTGRTCRICENATALLTIQKTLIWCVFSMSPPPSLTLPILCHWTRICVHKAPTARKKNTNQLQIIRAVQQWPQVFFSMVVTQLLCSVRHMPEAVLGEACARRLLESISNDCCGAVLPMEVLERFLSTENIKVREHTQRQSLFYQGRGLFSFPRPVLSLMAFFSSLCFSQFLVRTLSGAQEMHQQQEQPAFFIKEMETEKFKSRIVRVRTPSFTPLWCVFSCFPLIPASCLSLPCCVCVFVSTAEWLHRGMTDGQEHGAHARELQAVQWTQFAGCGAQRSSLSSLSSFCCSNKVRGGMPPLCTHECQERKRVLLHRAKRGEGGRVTSTKKWRKAEREREANSHA